MPATASRAGTKFFIVLFAALALLAPPFSSCSLFHANDEDDDEPGNGNGNDNAEDGNVDTGTADKTKVAADSEFDAEGGLPHPKKATAYDTRALLYATPQPPPQQLFRCIDQVTRITAEAGNQQDMVALSSQVTTLAAQDSRLYHFCFYQMMLRLDERLDKGGPLMTEVATAFLDGMKTLWMFARALDSLNGRTVYYDYLQKRYIQLSKSYFGRDVEPLGPPMGNFPLGEREDPPVMAKPARAAPKN